MKGSTAFFLFLALPSALFAQADSRPTISVLDLETSGISQGEMRLLVDFLSSNIIETKKFRVIDRAQRQAVLSEIEFSKSDCTDEQCQLEIGRMLSANQIVTGSVGKFGERFVITAKLIDVETAQSVNASSRVYSSLTELLDDNKNLVFTLLDQGAGPATDRVAIQAKPPVGPTVTTPGKTTKTVEDEVPLATIKLDGKTDDWADVPPLLDDRIGDDAAASKDSGTDIAKVFLARDTKYLYVRFLLADGRPNSALGPNRNVEYNFHLDSAPHGVYLRLQTRYVSVQQAGNTSKRWVAEFTRYDLNMRLVTVLVSGDLSIGSDGFEARYPLAELAPYVDLKASRPVTANICYEGYSNWVDTDWTARVPVTLNP